MLLQARLLIPAFLFILAVSIPMLGGQAAFSDAPSKKVSSLGWLLGGKQVLFVGLATLSGRYAIYEVLHIAMGSRPSEGILVGSVLLVIAAGCIIPQARAGRLQQKQQRLTALMGILGLLLIALQPPLPLQAHPYTSLTNGHPAQHHKLQAYTMSMCRIYMSCSVSHRH